VGCVLGGSAAAALAAGAAYIATRLKARPAAYSKVVASMNSLAAPPKVLNPDAKVTSVDVPDRPQDAIREAAGLVIGIASAGYLPTVFADNRDNQKAALEKRVLAMPPAHDADTIKDFLAFEKRNRHLVMGHIVKIDELNFDRWIARVNSSLPVRRRLMMARASLLERGITTNDLLDPESLHRATSRSSFCKFETLLKGTRIEENSSAPRLIQGAHPEMTVSVGPWMSAFQGRMKSQLDGRNGLLFTSGKTVREVGAFIGRKIDEGWTPFDDDVGAFDLSIIEPYCHLENDWCKDFRAPPLTRQLLQANVKTHGFTSLGWKYSVRGTRKSGDCGTSVFNSLLNLLFHLYIFCKERGCTVEQARSQLVMAAQGDDDVGAHTGGPIDWKHWMALLGFKSEPHYPHETARVEFCSHYLTRDSLGWTFKPKVGRIFAKFGVSLRAKEKDALAYLRGNALSIKATAASCPPLRLLVDWALAKTVDVTAKAPPAEPWKMRSDLEGEATPETWSDLETRYGYTLAVHKALEEEFRTFEPGQIVETPVFDHLCGCDTDGVARDPSSWFGLPIPDVPTGPEIRPERMSYIVNLPGQGAVAVDVPGKEPVTVGHVIKLACRKAKLGDGPNSSKYEASIAGAPIPPQHAPTGFEIDVRMKGLGGGSSLAAAAAAPAVAGAARVAADLVARVAGRLPAVISAAMSELPREIVSDTVEAAVLATWDSWVKIEAADTDEKKALGSEVIVVRVCGLTRVHTVVPGQSLAAAVMASHSVPMSAIERLEVFVAGRPAAWTDLATTDIEVRAKGLGGADISKSERKVAKLIRESGALPTSMGYLWATLDGFHDHEFSMDGVPDQMIAGSVRQCVRQTLTVSCPTALATGNWDCNITSFPDSLPGSLNQWTATQGTSGGLVENLNTYGITPNTNPPAIAGGVVAYSTASGTTQSFKSASNWIPSVQASVSAGGNRFKANVPGSWREYARAIEVINSTAPLYQQGQCIVWRQPMPTPTEATVVTVFDPEAGVAGTTIPGSVSAVRSPAPPATPAEAIQLLGSREWHAKEGAYVMNTSNMDSNPLINGQYMYNLWYDNTYDDQVVWGPNWVNAQLPNMALNTYPAFFPSALQPFNMGGAYFVGLSPQTTLTISIRSYVEIFPSQLGNTLTSLATPSAPYDERARRLYAECMKTMPPGVMLCENGFGDWLSDVAGKIANFVSPVANMVSRVASAIPHPLAQAVARGADVVSGVSGSFMAPSSEAMRDDGVEQSIQREKRMIRAESRAREDKNEKAEAKRSLALRQSKAAVKLMVRKSAMSKKKRG